MDINTEAIICLAWARVLGLVDDALVRATERRLEHVKNDADSISFVRLFGRSVLVGPQWAIDGAQKYADEELTATRTLMGIGREHRPRVIGVATLAFTDAYVTDSALERALVTDDPDAVQHLEKLCPPDDVAEVGLGEMSARFVLLGEGEQLVAGAGYAPRQGILAHLGVLTALGHRGSGNGRLVSAIALNDALDEGMVPQWRARADNDKSRRVAAALGFEEAGTQTTVALGT